VGWREGESGEMGRRKESAVRAAATLARRDDLVRRFFEDEVVRHMQRIFFIRCL
jgi:hypothetical protein